MSVRLIPQMAAQDLHLPDGMVTRAMRDTNQFVAAGTHRSVMVAGLDYHGSHSGCISRKPLCGKAFAVSSGCSQLSLYAASHGVSPRCCQHWA